MKSFNRGSIVTGDNFVERQTGERHEKKAKILTLTSTIKKRGRKKLRGCGSGGGAQGEKLSCESSRVVMTY